MQLCHVGERGNLNFKASDFSGLFFDFAGVPASLLSGFF
jgi:hypothetical protein